MQTEETVFYITYFLLSAVFMRCLIHSAVAKIFGPFIWGQGFCGWACWIAAILDWLPIKENRPIPKKRTLIRIPVLLVSLAIPVILIAVGYDFMGNHILGDHGFFLQTEKFHQLIFFLVSISLYYIVVIILAFVFRKKRAFCKIVCPASLVMKAQTKISLIKYVKPSGENCIECEAGNKACLMDVDVQSYVARGKKVSSSEYIGCGKCIAACPVGAIV